MYRTVENREQQTLKATDYGTPATFERVLLTDVPTKVDLPLGGRPC